jgi:signal transduction histidine kinase
MADIISQDELPSVEAAARRRRVSVILMGAAAHDLRTPLNTIAGWLQVLQSAPDLPEATRERAFKGLQSAVAQQTALADGLAQAAAIHMEGARGEAAPVDVEGALTEALAALDGEARAKTVELDLATEEVRLDSDPAMVAPLLRHALAGVLKFAAKGSRLLVDLAAPEGDQALEGGCTVKFTLQRSLLPAAGIGAILRYAAGEDVAKPSGVGAAFYFGVAQGIAEFLGGSLEMVDAGSQAEAALLVRLPSRA